MPFQSRLVAEDGDLPELVESVRTYGILEPVLIRPKPDGLYEIVAGERRVRAARKAGLIEIPAYIRALSDDDAFVIQLTENLQRKDLSEEEKSRALGELARRTGWNAQQIADKLKMSYRWVLTYLPAEFKDKDKIEAGKAGGEATAQEYRESQQSAASLAPKSEDIRQEPTPTPEHEEPTEEPPIPEEGVGFEPPTLAGPPEPEPIDVAEFTCKICDEVYRISHVKPGVHELELMKR
jgi:ParB/RepB/Spo0J family partition protein